MTCVCVCFILSTVYSLGCLRGPLQLPMCVFAFYYDFYLLIMIKICPFSIVIIVCVIVVVGVVVNFFTFSSSSTEPMGQLGTKHPLVKGIQVCSIEGLCHFARGDN